MPPLWWATRGHHGHVAARLLAEPNLDVNAVGQFQASIPDRSTSLHHAVQGQRLPILRLLLTERRLDPNITDRLRRTPLGWAASQGNSEVVELLLARPDIQVNAVERGEQPPLWLAARGGQSGSAASLARRYQSRTGYPSATALGFHQRRPPGYCDATTCRGRAIEC